jgi:hypothetical protein
MEFKILKNRKGVSVAISSVILVAATVAYALIASSWISSLAMDALAIEEIRVVNCQWAPDFSSANLTLTNVGTYGAKISAVIVNEDVTHDFLIVKGSTVIHNGKSSVLKVNYDFSTSTVYKFKLVTNRAKQVEYVTIADSSSSIPSPPSIHYIDAPSDVDGSPDKGVHSGFSKQQGRPDALFDTLTEDDCGAGLVSIMQHVNSSSSNVDGLVDVGTETSFANAQGYSPDGNFMSISEENLGGGSGSYPIIRSKTHSSESSNTQFHDVRLPSTIEAGDTLIVAFVCDGDVWVTWENEGTDWHVIYEEDAGNSGPTLSIAWKNAVGNEDGTTITVTTGSSEESVHLSYAIQNADDPAVSPPEASVEASGHSSSPNPGSLSPSGGSKNYLWFAFYGCDDDDMASSYPSTYVDNRETFESSSGSGTCAIGAASRNYDSNYDNPGSFRISSEQWEAVTVAVYPVQLEDDFELDFEYQWTSADFDQTTEQVCIYVQSATQTGEHLVAYEWNGASWQSLGMLNSNGWNNFTMTYLTGTTYTIKIQDELKSNDAAQSTWNIDCIMTNCSSTETNYELDVEVQFVDVDVGKNYDQICIFMGSSSGENLGVYVWNGDSWDPLVSELSLNQWNNVTRAITEETVTLRFLGGNESNDVVQSSWDLDCVLIYAPP